MNIQIAFVNQILNLVGQDNILTIHYNYNKEIKFNKLNNNNKKYKLLMKFGRMQ